MYKMSKDVQKGSIMNSEEFDEEFDLDRSLRLKLVMEKIFEENKELFERLENG